MSALDNNGCPDGDMSALDDEVGCAGPCTGELNNEVDCPVGGTGAGENVVCCPAVGTDVVAEEVNCLDGGIAALDGDVVSPTAPTAGLDDGAADDSWEVGVTCVGRATEVEIEPDIC